MWVLFAIFTLMMERKKYIAHIFTKGRNSVFLLFVLGTFVFWFLNKLDKQYNQAISQPITYIDLPSKFIFQETPTNYILVRVEASGFYFFSNAFKRKPIEISLKNIKKKDAFTYYLLAPEVKKQLRAQLKTKINILEVLEDSLHVKLGSKSFKKVPVITDVSIQYSVGHNSIKGVQFVPDSIEVSGPELQVKKIQHIKLNPYFKQDVNTSINEFLDIVKVDIPKISYNTEKINIKVDVEKITEKTLQIPVQIINTPKDNVVIYPKNIKVSCQILLSKFNDINTNDFLLVCNYNKRNNKYMEVKLVKKPKTILGVKLHVEKVEYLILK